MISRRAVLYYQLISLFAVLFSGDVSAHGGVVEEDDLCVIKVNYLRAHFKVYQPSTLGHEQYCEDLPMATESVFVMELSLIHISEPTRPY